MDFSKCKLYNIKRKRDLYSLLHTTKQELKININSYKVCIDDGRLLEKPNEYLKKLQKNMLYMLYELDYPFYLFSGVKKKSAIDNAIYHLNSGYMLKLDIRKFFPNTHRNNVYNFLKNKLNMSEDVASICTDIVTVNYNSDNVIINNNVKEFLQKNKIKNNNHLASGTPTSQILSYLVNKNMFDKIIKYAENHKLKCSIYVDDLTFSCTNRNISKTEESELINIIKMYGHKINMKKVIRYNSTEYKKVTGIVISPNNRIVIPNKIKAKIKNKCKLIKGKDCISLSYKNSLIGLINFANSCEQNKYNGLIKKIKSMDINNIA